MIVFGLLVGCLNDYLLRKGVPKIYVRRGFGLLILLSATMFVAIPLLECSLIDNSIIWLLLMTSFRSGVYGSVIPSYHDLSPTFYKSLLSLSYTITLVGGASVPMLMGYVGKDTIEQWTTTYVVSAVIVAVSVLVYVVLVETEVQPWDPEYQKEQEEWVAADPEEAEPWFAEVDLYGMFKSTKYSRPNEEASARSCSAAGASNEFTSVFKNEGFNKFFVKYSKLSDGDRTELVLRFKKSKSD